MSINSRDFRKANLKSAVDDAYNSLCSNYLQTTISFLIQVLDTTIDRVIMIAQLRSILNLLELARHTASVPIRPPRSVRVFALPA